MMSVHTHSLLITLRMPCCMAGPYVRINNECTHMCYRYDYLNHVVCRINMSDVIINVQTYATDNTYYTMLFLRSVCLI